MTNEQEWRSSISRIQDGKLENFNDVGRIWETPAYPEEVAEIFSDDKIPRKIIDFGCGAGRNVGCYRGIINPPPEIIGIDTSELAISRARSIYAGVEGVSFIHGNLVDKSTINAVGIESGRLVVMGGLMSNVIHRKDMLHILNSADKVLAPGGYIMFSDHGQNLYQPEDPAWTSRYDRDKKALKLAKVGDPYNTRGTIIIHPNGLGADDTLSATAEEIAVAIKEGKIDRFARHWDLEDLAFGIINAGYYDLVNIQVRQYSDGTSNPEGLHLTWHYLMIWKKIRSVEPDDVPHEDNFFNIVTCPENSPLRFIKFAQQTASSISPR